MIEHDTTFTCPKLGKLLTVKACLRRRQEPRMETVVVRQATEERARITEQREAGPLHPFCALECRLGQEHAAALRGLAAPAAPAAREEPPAPHLWTSVVPDVPIGPPPAATARVPAPNWTYTGPVVDRTVVRRAQAAASSPSRLAPITEDAMRHAGESPAPVQPEPPAEPAKESEMPRGKRAEPMKCCGSRSFRHRKTCTQQAVQGPAGPVQVFLDAAASAPSVVVAKLSDEQLTQHVIESKNELARRKQEALARAQKLGEVLSSLEA